MKTKSRAMTAAPLDPAVDGKPKPQYAAVPIRAMGDRRLTASHWRLLSAIAWHDRLGRNNIGCYTSNENLAREANVHYTNIPPLSRDLETWGYISKTRHPLKRRLRVYSLIYNEKPATVGVTTNNETTARIVGEPTNQDPRIVGVQKPELADSKEEGKGKYIPLKREYMKKEKGAY